VASKREERGGKTRLKIFGEEMIDLKSD